eukprot:2244727-Pleurochrysis_carterae.AAC.1
MRKACVKGRVTKTVEATSCPSDSTTRSGNNSPSKRNKFKTAIPKKERVAFGARWVSKLFIISTNPWARRRFVTPHIAVGDGPLPDDDAHSARGVRPDQIDVAAACLADERAHPVGAGGAHAAARALERSTRVEGRVEGV